MKNLLNKYKDLIPQENNSHSTGNISSDRNYFQIISDINSYADIQDLSES